MPKQEPRSNKDNGENTKEEGASFAFEKVPNKEAIAYIKNKGISPLFPIKTYGQKNMLLHLLL